MRLAIALGRAPSRPDLAEPVRRRRGRRTRAARRRSSSRRAATQPGGRPHAERVALAAAGERARGATLYVSLEPCVTRSSRITARPAPISSSLPESDGWWSARPIRDPDSRVAGRAMPASGGRDRRDRRLPGRGGAAAPSRPHHPGHEGAARRDRQARPQHRRLRRLPAWPAPDDHRRDRQRRKCI